MLPPLYQTHLENQLEPSELLFLNLLINVIQNIKEVSIEKIATALPLPILFESRRKKVQRFLSLSLLNVKTIWLPIIKTWLAKKIFQNQTIYLVIDRTSWARTNLLMISVIYDRRAIPVYFELPKLGSSNFAEQQGIFSQVLPIFNNYKTIVLGDREFCSIQLANWLSKQHVQFCLRLKKSEYVEVESGSWAQLENLGLKPGISLFLQGIKVTKTKKLSGFNVACKWQRSLHGWETEEGVPIMSPNVGKAIPTQIIYGATSTTLEPCPHLDTKCLGVVYFNQS